MRTALLYLTHPRDALCDWGIWGCDEHIRTGWFKPRWGLARRQMPTDSELIETLSFAEREEYFSLGMAGGISVAGNARIEELEQIMRYRWNLKRDGFAIGEPIHVPATSGWLDAEGNTDWDAVAQEAEQERYDTVVDIVYAELDEHGYEDDDEKRGQVAHHFADKILRSLS